MLLENKVAAIHGAGGPIGGAVAHAFASEGANVFLSGRTGTKLDALSDDIRSESGTARTAELDALDERGR
jgi:NADP-dependent 3-hydroxy acid dehydrogenase YdfG